MVIPEMIIFDYGQTLITEEFSGVRGTEEVLRHASSNIHNLTAEEVQREADIINKELGRFDPIKRADNTVEIPNHMFTSYLYESLGIYIDLPSDEIDRIFWDAAAPGTPTEGIGDLLEMLREKGIRTAVLSNICYAGKVVEERINRLLPGNNFEFILATSEYLFRKPSKRIFDLALKKAGLTSDKVWYIGDNYPCDIVGARESGIFPIWYTGACDYDQHDRDDVIKITSWVELEEILGLM